MADKVFIDIQQSASVLSCAPSHRDASYNGEVSSP